uniref:E3 ubiquitin-protein ligase TRIM39-like n=1 Tax=Semicossyphus pulcher TaxID=241346 RepID=UPI0037E9B3E3
MGSQISQSEVDFCCTICCNFFQNPVLLSCSHSFCKDCLQRWWAGKQILLCPLCKRRSSKSDPPCNLALKNLCESFLLELTLEEKAAARSEKLCSLHSEKLKLFCLDHQQPVCVVCRDSKTHLQHKFRPIDEAAEEYKKELRKHLKPLQTKVQHFNQVKADWDLAADQIKVQAHSTETQIREEFKKLRDFLKEEEVARITALRREEQLKSEMMMLRIAALNREIAALSDTVKATDKELESGSVTFLQNYKAAAERVQQRHQVKDPHLLSGALIDVAKHLGNLIFNIWNKMKEMVTYYPVILDPNTAGFNIVVSEDLKSLRYVEEVRQLPQNPERFGEYPAVLGSEGFNSGTHSWDVHVRSDGNWAVGVITESVSRKGDILAGYWEIWFSDGIYRAYSPPGIDKVLSVKKHLQRIRVRLDWNRGKLSFFDPDTGTHIYTFSQTFTERLFPFANTTNTNSLSMLPKKVILQLEM